MRDRDDGPAMGVHEALEDLEAGEVEVVGGLVEQEHVDARQDEDRQTDAGGLAARQGAHRQVQAVGREADLGQRRPGAGGEVVAPEGEERLEGLGVLVGPRRVVGEGRRQRVEARLGRRHAGAPGQVLGHALVRARPAALVEQPHTQRRRRPQDRAPRRATPHRP